MAIDSAPVVEAVVEPPMPPAPQAPTPRQRGIAGPLLGGALAALGGFALSHFNAFGLTAPVDGSAIAALSDRLGKIEAAQTDEASRLPALGDQMQGLDARVAALESAPAPTMPDLRQDDHQRRHPPRDICR